MAETAPEALEDKSSFSSLFSLLSALIDVREEDQRLLNSSTQEDGEIEREGGGEGGMGGRRGEEIEKLRSPPSVSQPHEMTL